MTDTTLFSPYTLDGITLPNRAVMAPLTRNRAGAGLVPSEFAADYYSQRAGAGLIITEATQISKGAQGYQDTPGLYTPEQVAAWRKVTDAVHAKGGRIFAQLWHVGRVSHVDLLDGQAPVAPSAIRAETQTFVNTALPMCPPPARWNWTRSPASSRISGRRPPPRSRRASAVSRGLRSEERRVGKECVSTCRSR